MALTPMLWSDTEAEQSAEFYTSVVPNSKIVEVTHYASHAATSGARQTEPKPAFSIPA